MRGGEVIPRQSVRYLSNEARLYHSSYASYASFAIHYFPTLNEPGVQTPNVSRAYPLSPAYYSSLLSSFPQHDSAWSHIALLPVQNLHHVTPVESRAWIVCSSYRWYCGVAGARCACCLHPLLRTKVAKLQAEPPRLAYYTSISEEILCCNLSLHLSLCSY